MKAILYTTSLALMMGMATPAIAQNAQEETFAGQTIQLYIGFGAGGAYDLYARLLARHMGKHLPGEPDIVPMNMEGAGSMLLTNWMYNVAPRDGTALATIARGVPFYPLVGEDAAAAQFDANEFNWIGSANDEVNVCAAWAASGVETPEDLDGMIMGGDGPTASGEQFARLMNYLLDVDIEIITGYGGGSAINLAMEQGEVEGRCGWSWSSVVASNQQWLDDGLLNIVIQMGSHPHPDIPHVPTLSSLIEDEEDQAILDLILARQPLGRPFLAPPGVPEARVELLREAFMATMEDPAFLAEAEQGGLEITPLSGQEVQDIVARVYANTTEELAARTREILAP